MEPTIAQGPKPEPAMVSIGTHRLSVSVSGRPLSSPDEPLVVIITGAGDVASSYVALEPLLRDFTRVFLYDRSGLGRSEAAPAATKGPGSEPEREPAQQSTAVKAAKELHTLLEKTQEVQTHNNARPPLLLVGHSYGAIVAREYLALYPGEVAGMVLSEGATERQSLYFRVPDPNIIAVMGDLKYATVTGLREDAKLTREQWRTRAIDIARGMEATQREADSFTHICETLGAKEQYTNQSLGKKPLSVIRSNSARDYERIYATGVEAGNGTEEQRRAFRELLDRWEDIDREIKEEQLLLSGDSRLVHLADCGHNVHLVRPDVVAEEIRWVRGRILDAYRDVLSD